MTALVPSRLALALALLVSTSGSALAQTNLLVILDASNSMWGQVDGQAKIEIAREVLSKLLHELPADTKVGLMAYGHRSEGDCADVELVGPIGGSDADGLLAKIKAIQPKGKTPIAEALRKSLEPLRGLADQHDHVLLISDGVETCGGDPCAVAAELAAAGVDVRVHVVGFNVNADDRRQLECIADAGKGRYFDAQSAESFRAALDEVRQVTQAPPPPPPPEPKTYFRDDFDGDRLSDSWEVVNPDPDSFIVEDGSLLLLANRAGSLQDGTVTNLLRLTKELPSGDWTMSARLSIEYQTEFEMPFMGLYADKDSYLVAAVPAYSRASYHRIGIFAYKRAGEDTSQFEADLSTAYENRQFTDFAKELPSSLLVRLQKEGRNYFASAKWEGVDGAEWKVLDKFTLLRQKGSLALGISQTRDVPGESFMKVDWVQIETP